MHTLRRISAWGLLVGWLILAFAAKTVRGDAAGLWILLSPMHIIGIGILLLSSVGVYIAIFSSSATASQQHQSSQHDTELEGRS
jgi:hypothetical protein